MRTKRLLSLIIATILCFSAFSVVSADDITQELLVTSAPVEDVDYSQMSNWAYWGKGENKAADLFIVCPTVDMGKSGNFNADVENTKYRDSFIGALNMELGIYNEVASVYAPYYRQATFPVYSLDKAEQEKYLSIAYQDVKNAFIYYAENCDSSRPLILAGFSQGSDLVIRLMKDVFDDPKYQKRLVAAYCIGWKLTEDEIKAYPHLKPAQGETDTGVIIAFNSEDKEITSSLIVAEDEKTYSINPLNWKTTAEVADKSLNKGACFTDYSGNITEEITGLTGAYIDEKRGTLKVTDIVKEEYPGKLFVNGIYHLYDYQFFFRNLQENVSKRLDAFVEKYDERIDVVYNDKDLIFDVEPIAENGRTLVPFRAIFEAMGCAVDYANQNGTFIVTAHRGNDSLTLTIGENKMYFNSKEIALDVSAKIKDNRTLVPLRAISEAFECEVHWYGETKTVFIYSAAEAYSLSAEKLSKTITDDKGNVLVEAVAYYPVLNNPTETPYIDTINSDAKWDAQKFMEEAKSAKEDALLMRETMGEEFFTPFVYELTFEQTYNVYGDFSYTNYKYVNMGGAHPTTTLESRNYDIGMEEEYSLSTVISEDCLDVSLADYVTDLFVKKMKEIDPDGADVYTHDYILEYIGYMQFYLTKNSVVLYFGQGEIAPYALGVIEVEIPYDPELFQIDMSQNCLDEFIYELEYDNGYEWQIAAYADTKLSIAEETTGYDPKTLLSEYYPVGITKYTIKGIAKGNGGVVLLHAKKGEGPESATRALVISFYVDENNKITCVKEDDAMYLIN